MTGPPDNGAYMAAAYIVIAVYAVGYALSLWRRSRRGPGT